MNKNLKNSFGEIVKFEHSKTLQKSQIDKKNISKRIFYFRFFFFSVF